VSVFYNEYMIGSFVCYEELREDMQYLFNVNPE